MTYMTPYGFTFDEPPDYDELVREHFFEVFSLLQLILLSLLVLSKKLKDISPFCEATDTPVLDF